MPVPLSSATQGPLSRSLLRDEAYRAIRDAIVRGKIEPGEKITDLELQAWLGVSRTPIREALLRLERSGLVTAVPGSATRAAPYDANVVQQSRVVAAELHALATKLAVPHCGAEQLEYLRSANQALREGHEAADIDACVAADDDFHEVFLTLSDNAVLMTQLEQIMPLLRRAEYLHFRAGDVSESVSLHNQIIEAVAAGQIERSAELTRRNWVALR